MPRTNGKPEIDPTELDVEHELPASDDTGDMPTQSATAGPSLVGDSDLQKLKAERDMLVDRLARLQAEFENARKRTAREQQEYRDYALTDTIKTLLPVLDSFDRALQVSAREKSDLRNGLELIYRQLQDALNKIGIRAVPAKGELFDPHVHEAIEMVDTSEAKDHQILDELQKGYKLKDRLLRPAMVRVARNPGH
jgi:molecular chaperone GrpE